MLLKKNRELNRQEDASQSAPIHYATSLGDVKMVCLLLKYDPFVAHIEDSHGFSAIHIAASMDHDNMIKEILSHCPDTTELIDHKGNTFLHVAAKKNAVAVVRLVLSDPLLRQSINETDHEGNTPLHLAVMDHSLEIVRLLLSDSRVDANVINCKGFTPLDVASSCDDSNFCLRMNEIFEEPISVGSKFGPNRMDLKMGTRKDQRSPKEKLDEYNTDANNLSIVAGLIATVTFAAAFTLPGGYSGDDSNQKEGMAILANKLAFKVFLISDTIAMLCSLCAVYLLLVHGYSDQHTRHLSLRNSRRFIMIALVGMVVAFPMGIYVVVVSKCRLLAVLICVMAAGIPSIACMIA